MTKSIGMIVAGEIGASETRLALCGLDVGRPIVLVEETEPNGIAGLAPMVERFLRKHRPPPIRAAAFVAEGALRGPASLASELGIDSVAILSAAEGVAHAIPALDREDIAALWSGESGDNGNQVVVSVGASASVAGSYWNGTEHRPFASDGAHADFAPSSSDEVELAQQLLARGSRVTMGDLLSSAGLVRLHEIVRGATPADAPRPADAATILREAGVGIATCRMAVARFVTLTASAAANLALTLRATGGVYVAGDLVPALHASLASDAFREAFCKKGPMAESLGRMPVAAVLHPRAALLGAATVAARAFRTQRGAGWAS